MAPRPTKTSIVGQILSCDRGPGDLQCLHGIRVVSCALIVLFHCGMNIQRKTDTTASGEYRVDLRRQWWVFPFNYGPAAVDNFFLLSGCLSVPAFLASHKQRTRSHSTGSTALRYVIHRYFRLLPMTVVTLFNIVFFGPMMVPDQSPIFDCLTNLPALLFHVWNFTNPRQMCMVWTWSNVVDFQLHCLCLSVLLVWVSGWRKTSGALWVCFIITGVSTPLILNLRDWSLMLTFGTPQADAYFSRVHIMPWSRAGVFAIGQLLGWTLHRHSHTPISVPKPCVVAGWALAIGVGLTSLVLAHDNIKTFPATGTFSWTDGAASALDAGSRHGLACAMAWTIFACCTGNGGAVNRLLSWRWWLPLSRLSFGVYMLHLPIYIGITSMMTDPSDLNLVSMAVLYVSVLTFTLGLSLLVSVAVETPARLLEAWVLDTVDKTLGARNSHPSGVKGD